jgi:hypothetical protein
MYCLCHDVCVRVCAWNACACKLRTSCVYACNAGVTTRKAALLLCFVIVVPGPNSIPCVVWCVLRDAPGDGNAHHRLFTGERVGRSLDEPVTDSISPATVVDHASSRSRIATDAAAVSGTGTTLQLPLQSRITEALAHANISRTTSEGSSLRRRRYGRSTGSASVSRSGAGASGVTASGGIASGADNEMCAHCMLRHGRRHLRRDHSRAASGL